METDDSQAKAARNQSLFREVNERIEQLQMGWNPVSTIDFICECANDECSARVNLTVEQYEAVRASSVRFTIVPGHVYPEMEHLVEEGEGYWVVEKMGAAAPVAIALDPRRQRDSAAQ